MEECAEIQKEASKALRFGLHDSHEKTTPELRLKTELNDLIAIWGELTREKVDVNFDINLVEDKLRRLKCAMKYSDKKGRFEKEKES